MSTLTLRLEAYAKDAQKLITAAQALADERQHLEVEPLHLFYRLVERDPSVQGAVERAGVSAADVLVETEAQLRRLQRLPDAVAYLSPRMLELLGRAEGEAARAGGRPTSVADLFLATTQEASGPVSAVLRAVGLSAPVLRATLAGGQVGDDGARAKFGLAGKNGEAATPKKSTTTPSGAAALGQYGIDLTAQARAGKFDPTVGRDGELRRMLDVLARRRDHNPLLVGEAGIGKSAIVQELARRMAADDVPTMLRGKRLVALEMGTLVAGAKLRGELEERVRAVLDAARTSGGEVILYLPDLASLAGERGAGELVANALAEGSVRAIATATPDAVRKSLEESSLARRFVTIAVEPPTESETVAILRGLVARFEEAHGVRISDPALVAAATFAKRYVPGSALPRSAIDLVDEAAARVRVQLEGVPAELDRLERRLESLALQVASLADDTDVASVESRLRLEKERDELAPKARALRERWSAEKSGAGADVARLRKELLATRQQANDEKDEAKASSLRFGAIPLLEKQLKVADEALAARGGADTPLVSAVVTEHDVADVISAWTGVPVARMLEGESEKLLKMEARLGARVIGQDPAVRAVSKAVRRGRVGLRDPRKPIGSFLFLGPTGVGKTELAKALAELLFDDEAALTRLDMSEFMEKHTVARLLGAPPGYVDSDEGGFLTEAVRRKPYSVVLFDELEKAHPDVFNILLQVLDDGRLTDSRGRLAQFADTVIIMTSNVGGTAILAHEGDPESLREKTTEALRGHFRPEFLNRIDDVVIFDRLSKENLRGIADIQLKGLAKLLAERRLSLSVSDAAKDRLTDLGYEPAFGARPLKRVILKHLQDPLAEEILRGGWGAGDTIVVDVGANGEFTFGKKS